MDRFEGMSMLLAVVDNGSFSAAARAVRIPVATLSRKVSELEARFCRWLLQSRDRAESDTTLRLSVTLRTWSGKDRPCTFTRMTKSS